MEEIEKLVKDSKVQVHSVCTLGKKPPKNQDIDTIIKKTVEGVKGKAYNRTYGKPGQDQGLRKEV
jgi:hypothetical protein